MNKIEYSTALTGAGFMMYEFRQVVALKIKGLTSQEIREKVLDENIFQHNKISSLQRALPYLLKRIDILDNDLQQMVVNEGLEIAKAVNFYSIMKTDRLFFEFMQEVIEDLLQDPGSVLEKKDVNVFFASKSEQSEFIRNLAESTIKRLQSSFLKVLLEVGILTDLKTRQLRILLLDEQVKVHITKIGDKPYIKAMGEDEGI